MIVILSKRENEAIISGGKLMQGRRPSLNVLGEAAGHVRKAKEDGVVSKGQARFWYGMADAAGVEEGIMALGRSEMSRHNFYCCIHFNIIEKYIIFSLN